MKPQMPYKEAAEVVLRKAGKPLHWKEITKRAKGLINSSARTPEKTMASALYTDIKQNGSNSVFVKYGNGVFGLNTRSPRRNIKSTPNYHIDALLPRYKYTEEFVHMNESGYHKITLTRFRKAIFCQKSMVKKALKKEFPREKFENRSCLYALIINAEQKKVYVGQTRHSLDRVADHISKKKFTQVAIFNADELSNSDIRENLEIVMMNAFKNIGWKLDNTITTIRSPELEYFEYKEIKEFVPVMVSKISCLAQNKNDVAVKEEKLPKKAKKSSKKPKPNPNIQESITKLTNTIEKEFNALLSDKPDHTYFYDGKRDPQHMFAVLRYGKSVLTVYFLAPDGAVLPKDVTRGKRFYFPHDGLCSMKLTETNMKQAIEMVRRSLKLVRSSNRS